MADAAFKPEKDYSKEADKQISEAEQLAKVPNNHRRPQIAINLRDDLC